MKQKHIFSEKTLPRNFRMLKGYLLRSTREVGLTMY
jgi:hypothetical protein